MSGDNEEWLPPLETVKSDGGNYFWTSSLMGETPMAATRRD